VGFGVCVVRLVGFGGGGWLGQLGPQKFPVAPTLPTGVPRP
jgi:hypothetical protein